MRIGLFTGTFSPPHYGEITAARAFMQQMWLDVLYVVPTLQGPQTASPQDRLEMCRLAFADVDGVIVSDMAVTNALLSGSAGLLHELGAGWGADTRLFYLVGTDAMMNLEADPQVEEIFRISYPCYVRRENDQSMDDRIVQKITNYLNKYGKIVRKIMTQPVPVSAADIRRCMRDGLDITAYVPASVAAYADEKGLYR